MWQQQPPSYPSAPGAYPPPYGSTGAPYPPPGSAAGPAGYPPRYPPPPGTGVRTLVVAPKPLCHCPPLQLVPCCGRALTAVEPLFCFYFCIIPFNRRRLRTAGIRHRSRSPAIRRSHSPSIRRPSRSPAIPAPTRPSPILRHKHNSSLSSGYSSLLAMCVDGVWCQGMCGVCLRP
jgi:hypothetical protein